MIQTNFTQARLMTGQCYYRSNERGAALIVVLLFLILIMLAGAMAVRQSNNDLKTATADQINTLLLQSSDSANERLEAVVNSPTVQKDYDDLFQRSGLFGYFITDDDHRDDEFVYCYKPTMKKYQINNATVFTKTGGTVTNNGICDYTNPADYTTERQTVMTQVSITQFKRAEGTDEKPFLDMPQGRDSEDASGKSPVFNVRSTAMLPAYNEPVLNSKPCLASIPTSGGAVTAAENALDCLHQTNTPSKMLYTQATLENRIRKIQCIRDGRAGSADVSATGVINDPRCRAT